MLTSVILQIGKGIGRSMDNKLQACKIVLSSAQNRLILGLMLFGLGAGLIASAYLNVM